MSLDHEHVFVMLPVALWGSGLPAEDQAIRDKYPRSGLYRKDQPDKPLWTINGHAGRGQIWLSPDRVYLVMFDGSPVRSSRGPTRTARQRPELLDGGAVSFYADGRPLRSVTIRELVTYPSAIPVDDAADMPEWFWSALWYRSHRVDDDTLTVEARDGTRTVFDIRTGVVIRQDRPPPGRWMNQVGVGLGLVVGVGVLLFLWRRRRNRRAPDPLPSAPGNDEPGPCGAGSRC